MTYSVRECPLWNAAYQLAQAHDAFLTAQTLRSVDHFHEYYANLGIKNLEKAANALGYDLVKRQEKQEAA